MRQGNRAYSVHGKAADEYLEHFRSPGVRLLCQCKSQRRPPALESGQRTAPRRIHETAYLDVQWVRPGREPVQRNGFEEEFLVVGLKARSDAGSPCCAISNL